MGGQPGCEREASCHGCTFTNKEGTCGPTRVLAAQIAHAGVEQVSPHSAQLVQQVAARDVVWIPKTLRLQALVRSQKVGIEVRKSVVFPS